MSKECNIFLAFTPYHVLLAYCMAAKRQQSGERNVLFIISEFPEADTFADSLRVSKRNVFSDVVLLQGEYRKRSIFVKIGMRKKNAALIRDFVRKLRIHTVFVGNDQRVEAQAALYHAKRAWPQSKGVYVEDGTVAYPFAVPKKSMIRVLLGRVIFGSWWQDIPVPGTSSWIDQTAAIFPSLVRPELKEKEVIPIEKECFLRIKEDPSFMRYIDALGISLGKLQAIDVLFVSHHSETEDRHPRYREVAKHVLAFVREKKLRLAVKYHPRELLGDFLSVRPLGGTRDFQQNDALLLPHAFPLELLYMFAEKPPKLIIGGVSSSLLTAIWLLGNASKVACLAPLYDYFDPSILEVFQKSNIQLVHTNEELEDIIAAVKS